MSTDAVHVLTYWLDGEDMVTAVFLEEQDADTAALSVAKSIWDKYWDPDDDWPIQPETWHEIFVEVLERAGSCFDILQVEYQPIR